MKRATIFTGAPRSVLSIARLTVRDYTRNRSLVIVVGLFLLFMAIYRNPDADLSQQVAAALFLDFGLGGLSVLVLMCSVFVAVGINTTERKRGSAFLETERMVGPAAYFWGRTVGLALFTLSVGALLGTIVLVHYFVRVGDGHYELADHVVSDSFDGERLPRYLDEKGDVLSLEFPMDTRSVEGDVLRGRLYPRLILSGDGAPLRTYFPLKVTLRDPDGDWKRQAIARIAEGKPAWIDVPLPSKNRPHRLVVDVEKMTTFYRVKFYRRDISLLGSHHPVVPSLLRSVLVSCLYGVAVAMIALFCALRMSWGAGLLTSTGLVVLMTSLEMLNTTLLSPFSPLVRVRIIEGLRVLFPDFSVYDTTQALTHGIFVGWTPVLELLLRILATAAVLGFIQAWWPVRRARL